VAPSEVVGTNERFNFKSAHDPYSDGPLASSQAIPTFGAASSASSSQWWLSKAPFSSFGPHSAQQQSSAAESRNNMQQPPPIAGIDSMLSRYWDFQQENHGRRR
jgi:hypothetical protein